MPGSGPPLSRALALHREGRAAEALACYDEALADDPGNAEAWHFSGVACHQLGEHHQAVARLSRAARLAPARAEFLANLGVAHYAAGDRERAMEAWQRALELEPARADARFHLGVAALERGDPAAAQEAFSKVLEHHPSHSPARRRLIRLHLDRGDPAAASALLDDACDFALWLETGQTCLAAGRLDSAERSLKGALRRSPGSPDALNALGNLHARLESFDAAAALYREALTARPDFPEALNNLGNVLSLTGNEEEAVARLEQAIALDAGFVDAISNLANAYDLLGDAAAAETLHRRALALDPDNPVLHFNLAINRLRAGDFDEGFREYEWRKRKRDFHGAAEHRAARLPEWRGETLSGRDLVVWNEQGVGDTVHFAGYLPALEGRVRRLVIETDPRLVPLFARSFPHARVCANVDDIEPPERAALDPAAQCAAGSVCRFSRFARTSGGDPEAYLQVDADARRVWQGWLAGLGEGLKVGISWRGGKSAFDRRRRGLALASWAGVLRTPGIVALDIQYDDLAAEREQACEETGVAIRRPPMASPREDLDGFASLLAALDLVISVDNSTVHLAGALGVRTWVLLPFVADWRWGVRGSTSNWYANAVLYRQHRVAAWDDVLQRVARDLAGLADARG